MHQSLIRVLIVDDHEILRLGLAIFLEARDDLELVGQAANGQEAVELCAQLQPDVVVMDIAMPVMDGLTATAIITDQYPGIGVVILTSSLGGEGEPAARRVGASSYLRKTVTADEIASAIHAAVA